MSTSTRYIGFCPVCQRQIKVRDERLVHHGYQRPGTGEIVGDCFGVDRPPHELSPETATEYLTRRVVPMIQHVEDLIRRLGPPGEPPSLYFKEYQRGSGFGRGSYVDVARRRDEVSEQAWEQQLKGTRMNAQGELRYWQGEAQRLEQLIAEWRPATLTTVEEEVVKAAEARGERERQKKLVRETKLAEALVSLQQRLDSAVRNKRPETVRNLYEDGYRKLHAISYGELRHADVIKLMDRDHVWAAFGLLAPDGSYVLSGDAVRIAFKPWSPFERTHAPWPAELGGGKAKVE